jgi:hypothetical protein
LQRERAAQDLRVEGPGEAAVPGERDDGDGLLLLVRLQQRARAVPAISSSMRSAYGRIASIRACALRSFAAATSSIARVIFRVLRIDRMRRLMS